MHKLVKRDGRREEYEGAKLARSLTRAGVAPYMLTGILDAVDPTPGMDTGTLRARVESELALRQPGAARRYACTRSLAVRGSELAGYGWVCLNPETVSRLGLRPGDTAWLSHDGTSAPFSVESFEDVERGCAWLNPRELAAMGVRAGTRLAASSLCDAASPASVEPQDSDRGYVTGPVAVRTGEW